MTGASAYSPTDAVLLMTLCEYAYIDEQALPGETITAQAARMRRDIDAALAASPYTAWQVAWGPGLNADRSNMLYVARNQATNQYAVVIRGTDWLFWLDWVEDFSSLLGLVPFPYADASAEPGIEIAAGTAIGFQEVIQLTGSTATGEQIGLLDFLQQARGAQVFVTGHSLGGGLASVVAPWLAYEFGSAAQIAVYTFAAPSAGNDSFADYYNSLFTAPDTQSSTAFRFYNTLDLVPNGWATLRTIETYYTPFPTCPADIKALVEDAANFVGTKYVQVGTADQGSAVELPGHVVARPATTPAMPGSAATAQLNPIGDALFLYEAAQQHASTMYLHLLGTPPTPALAAKLRGARLRGRAVAPGGGVFAQADQGGGPR